MRIVLLSNMFPPDSDGGLEVNAWKLATALRAKGHQVDVLTSRFRKGFAAPGPEPDWVHRILGLARPWSSRWVGLRYKPTLAAALWNEISTLKANVRAVDRWSHGKGVDVVYCFGMSLIGTATVLPFQRQGIPTFFHQGGGYLEARYNRDVHESIFLRLRRRFLAIEEQVDLRNLGYVSRFLLEQGRATGFLDSNGRGTGVLAILPRGIEFALREDVERDRQHPPLLLMAGRILPIKGYHNAIKAAGLLARRRPDLAWNLSIAGGADNQDLVAQSGDTYLAELTTLIEEEGLRDRVRFLGKLSRAEFLEQLAGATAFVSASIFGEPFANTIIETLASGTPLIVSNDGSSQEVVEHERSALVFDKHDVQTLSEHMERILTDPALRLKLASEGLDTIRKGYTLDAIVEQTEDVLRRLVEQRP